MATVNFTPQLERFLTAPPATVAGDTVKTVLSEVFADNRKLEGYVLDEQGRLRKHVAVFVDGKMIEDREDLSDPVGEGSEIFVMQALSGG
jgi:sulfur carrier protein ThiS